MRALRTRKPTASLQAAERGLSVRLRHAVGLRQTFTVGDVRYRELTTERLRHALSRQGPGYKDYEVMFPGHAGGGDHAGMRIRATPDRIFADLVGPRLLPLYARAETILRPGMRALILEGGTGYAAEWVASRVAPSGAVVSLDRDQHAVQYAQKRYTTPNISFELGGLDALAGETDGAFNAAIAVAALRESDNPGAAIAELWRVTGPAGWLLIACPAAQREDTPSDAPAALAMGAQQLTDLIAAAASNPPPVPPDAHEDAPACRPGLPPTIRLLSGEREPWSIALAVKPVES